MCKKIIWHLGVSNAKTGSPNAGLNFNVMALISNHNTALEETTSKCNTGSVNHLSNKIQNEFTGLLGNEVWAEKISKIKRG
jgi:hypothetical protein